MEYVTVIRTSHKIRGNRLRALRFLFQYNMHQICSHFLHSFVHCFNVLLGFAFNPVPVTAKNKKSENSASTAGLSGDRALLSLVNNTLEIYHINSPEAPSSSSGSQKKDKKGGKGGDDVEDEEEEEEVVKAREEAVLKQSVIDLHGHR